MILKNAIVLKALLPEIGLLRQQLEAADWQGIGETEFRRDTFVPGLQRQFKIGYNRAAWLIEALEYAGVVSPMDTSGSRTVLRTT